MPGRKEQNGAEGGAINEPRRRLRDILLLVAPALVLALVIATFVYTALWSADFFNDNSNKPAVVHKLVSLYDIRVIISRERHLQLQRFTPTTRIGGHTFYVREDVAAIN